MPLLIWSGPQRQTLAGFAVLRLPRFSLGLAEVWRSEQAALPALLIAKGAEGAVLAELLSWLRANRPGVAGLVLPRLPSGGAAAEAARSLAGQAGLRLDSLRRVARAALDLRLRFSSEENASGRHRKEWRRLERRLAEQGPVEVRIGAGPAEIDRFLDLEARGWKGARGTALRQEASRAAFARESLTRFAELGGLRIHELVLNGAPIAMGVELRSGAAAFFWKIAYDEAFASFSPGVQLTRAMARAFGQGGAGDIDFVDSCAMENHPMIDRLWPQRLALTDLAVAVSPRAALAFRACLGVAATAERGRAGLKRLVYRALGRKLS